MINYLCKASAGTIVWIVVDILLLAVIVAALCYIIWKSKKSQPNQSGLTPTDTTPQSESAETQSPDSAPEKSYGDKATNLPTFFSPNAPADSSDAVADKSYLIPETNVESHVVSEPQHFENKVEHFTNQISNISEEATTELKSKVTFTPRTNPEPPRRVVKDETLNLNEKKSTPITASSFEDSTSFLDTLKAQQTTSKAKSTKKTTTSKTKTSRTASSSKTAGSKPKRQYTKKKDETK